jgi:predicted nuclease with TOPRIM domain
LQALLKETIKENKSLQNKQSKLEAKYVEVLKETKALKKDHVVFTSFFINFFNGEGNVEPERQVFQEQALGQYELNYLRKLAEQK